MLDITICIVTYKNDLSELTSTVNSVLNTNLDIHLYIVDNSPTDELKVNFQDPRIEYIFNNSNIGFGAGHNIAIKKAIGQSKYHLILNPDIYFSSGILEKIMKIMDQGNYGMLLPKVVNPDGSLRPIRRLLPTPLNIFGKLFPSTKWFREKESEYRTEFLSYDKTTSAPFLSGCFMFCRTSVFSTVGLFDERYFMYMEDVDLSRRFYTLSTTVYSPLVSIVHMAHTESHRNIKLAKIHLQSAVKYFNKWGWFFDSERAALNQKVYDQLHT